MNDFGVVLGGAAIPLVSLVCGLILWKAPPPINAFFGYRSKRLQKNEFAWNFAQKTAGRLLVTVCAPTALASLFTGIIIYKKLNSDGKYWTLMALVVIQVVIMALINLKVERKLRSAFDENGKPRG